MAEAVQALDHRGVAGLPGSCGVSGVLPYSTSGRPASMVHPRVMHARTPGSATEDPWSVRVLLFTGIAILT